MNNDELQPDAAESAEALRTAYALGEVAPAVRRAMAEQLADDPAARSEVDSLAALATLGQQLRRAAAEEEPSPAHLASIRIAVEARLDELAAEALASPASLPAVHPWRRRISEHWRSLSPGRRLGYIAAAAAACLLLVIAPISMFGRGGDHMEIVQDTPEEDDDSTPNPLVGPTVPPTPSGDRSAKSPPNSALVTPQKPRTVPSPDAKTGQSGASGVAQSGGPDRPADAALREQTASRQYRTELLQAARAQQQLAKSAAKAPGPGIMSNVAPEVPANGNPAGAELFPPLATVEGRSAILLREVAGRSFEDVCERLGRGELPPAAAVWPEEFVNRFHYADPPAQRGTLGVAMEAAAWPWGKKNQTRVLLRVTLRSGGAAGVEPDSPAAPLRNVSVGLRFRPEVVRNYELLACGQADAKAAAAKVAAALDAKTQFNLGDWPAGRTVTLLYLLSVQPHATISQMDSVGKSSAKAKPQAAPALQRLASLAWWCDGPQGTRNGGDRSLDYSDKPLAEAPSDLRLAAAAATFALALRDAHPDCVRLAEAEALARSVSSTTPAGQREELLRAMEAACKLASQ